MLAVMSGPHPGDHTSLPRRFTPLAPREDLAGLRIAYSRNLGHARVDAEVAEGVALSAKTLEKMGASVEEIDPPWGPTGPELIRALWEAAYAMLAPARVEYEAMMDPGLVACHR